MRRVALGVALVLCVADVRHGRADTPEASTSPTAAAAAAISEPAAAETGLRRPEVQAVEIFPQRLQLRGPRMEARLLVSQTTADGRRIDRTEETRFRSAAEAIVEVDAAGRVRGVGNGVGEVEVELDGQVGRVEVQVMGMDQLPPPDFETEIQPMLAALGCSAGACHGKQGGQNGFQLSLLGFDDDFDHIALTREARGRRIFPSAPEQSLLLLKATATIPHGGGRRMEVGGRYYEQLVEWIRRGAPRHSDQPLNLERIEILPNELVLAPQSRHRVVVLATFSDGSSRDVTQLAALSSNDSVLADIQEGYVQTGPYTGQAAVMARFMDQITTSLVLVPRPDAPPPSAYAGLPETNFIDRLVWQKLQSLNIVPSGPADDAKFLRRVWLDIVGQLPPPEVVREFLADSSPDKRERMVNQLLEHPGYADHWANKWVDLLRPNPYRVGIKAVLNYDDWIRQAFRENRPYDEFVRGLLTAQGSTWRNGAVTLFRDRRSPDELATMVSQLFLGVRLECARCHHHPFEVWGQDDFYSFAAYFGRVNRKGTGLSPPISGGEELVFVSDSGNVSHPRTGQTMEPRPPGGQAEEIPAGHDPRTALVDWMTSDQNPYFAKVIANRVWAELMGHGIVEPVDDIRATNPPSNAALLDALADYLKQQDYNLKALIRQITTSAVYALESRPNATNADDHRNYSRYYRQRLRAEVLLDAINDVTLAEESLEAMAPGSRSNEIWTHRIPSLFLDTFGRPDPNQDPPCERTTDTAVVQALHLMNSPALHSKVTSDTGRAAQLAASDLTPDQIVDELYLRMYSRYPTKDEQAIGLDWFARADSRRQAVEDLMWALINSAEFVFKD